MVYFAYAMPIHHPSVLNHLTQQKISKEFNDPISLHPKSELELFNYTHP